MDWFKFHDVRVEKAHAIGRYRRVQRITTLCPFVEFFVFLIVVSMFSPRFAFVFQSLRGISVTLISPRSVFVVGNAIVILLFLISGQFSQKKDEKITDFYDEYVERCRNNQQTWRKEEKSASVALKHGVCCEEKALSRTHSANLDRQAHGEERCRDLRRSMSEQYRKSTDCRRMAEAGGGFHYAEDEMGNEEFRRTVEAFIARQQRFLRDEEESSAVASVEA